MVGSIVLLLQLCERSERYLLRLKKCVPKSRRCERCTSLGIEECTYGGVKKRGTGGTLRMGEACTPCRFVCTHPSPLTPPGLIRLPLSLSLRIAVVRKKKRVSCNHPSTTKSRISCILKFLRNATPNVRARPASNSVGNAVVFTTSQGPPIT